jgi:hypothetical protein
LPERAKIDRFLEAFANIAFAQYRLAGIDVSDNRVETESSINDEAFWPSTDHSDWCGEFEPTV